MVSLVNLKKEPLKGSLSQAHKFLAHFTGINHIVCRPDKGEWHMLRSATDLDKFLDDWLASELNVQFMVNETCGRVEDRTGRKDEDITKIRAIWADFDSVEALPEFPLPPSLIVQSSPGKWQVYWLTNPPAAPASMRMHFKDVLTRLVLDYGADEGAVSLSRVLRVPGTYNFSSKYAQPHRVQLLNANGTIYHWTEIIKHFPPVVAAELPESKKHLKDAGGTFNEHAYFNAFLSGDSITPSMNDLIMHWAHHYSAAKIEKKLDQLFSEVPTEIMEEHKKRYFAAQEQIGKFLKTAKAKIAKERETSNLVKLPIKIRPLLASDMVDFTAIPEQAVPPTLYDVAKATHNYLRNGIEPSLIMAISSVSILLNKNVIIHEIGDTTTTFCTTGIVLAMTTGSRKTQIFKIIGKPILEYEEQIREKWESEKHSIDSQKYMLEQQKDYCEKEIKKAASKGTGLTEMQAHGEARAKILAQIEALQTTKPSVYVQDTTEAAVVDVMAENRGTIAVYTDEGRNFIKNVLGRFESQGGGSSEGWVTNGMGGQMLKVNRKGGGETTIPEPCLNIVAMIQPDKATEFKDHKAYKESGMAARLPVYHYPSDDIKMMEESDRTRLIDQRPLDKYYNTMRELYVNRADNPMVIEISDKAQERVNSFNQRVVQLLKTTWNRDTNRTNKIITQAVVLGAIMAAVEDPDFRMKLQSDPSKGMKYTLGAKHINMGCLYAEALYEGMLKSTSSLDNLSIHRAAISFAASLVASYKANKIYEGFSNNSYLQQKYLAMTKENRDGVIEMLVDHGWLYTTKGEQATELNMGYPGGKSNPGDTIYHLNVDDVIYQLDMQEKADKATNKQYTK